MAVIKMPTEQETALAFEAYCLALGKVAHAWNYLFERIGRLFVAVIRADEGVCEAIWNSSDNDRLKIGMFKAALDSAGTDRWPDYPIMKADLKWLLDTVAALTDARNSAIHAPCSLAVGPNQAQMATSIFSGHARAKKLLGKDILIEFDWLERWTEELSMFVCAIESAVSVPGTWPKRPGKPDRRTKQSLPHPTPPGYSREQTVSPQS